MEFVGLKFGAVAATLVVLALVGCGGAERPATDLSISVSRPTGDDEIFHLTCDPLGGNVADPTRACAMIASNPSIVAPPRLTASCLGGIGVPPNITVQGTAGRAPVAFDVRYCDLPDARGRSAILWLRAVGLDELLDRSS